MGSPARISHGSYPHIVEAIVASSDYKTLLSFRATCSTLKTAAHKALCNGQLSVTIEDFPGDLASHVKQVELDLQHKREPVWREVVLRSDLGVLPFRTEADWAFACSHSDPVEIDGGCLGRTLDEARIDMAGPVAMYLVYSNINRADWRELVGSLSQRSGLGSLHRALSQITAPVAIKHLWDHPAPVLLPPADTMTLMLDPNCNCGSRVGSSVPKHTAKEVIVLISELWEPGSFIPVCALAKAALAPSVEVLTLSARDVQNLAIPLQAILSEHEEQNTQGQSTPLEIKIEVAEDLGQEPARVLAAAYAHQFGVPEEKVAVVHNPKAGIVLYEEEEEEE